MRSTTIGIEFLTELFRSITERGRKRGRAPRKSREQDYGALFDALLARRGEATSLALAEDILASWSIIGAEQRRNFLQTMAHRFGADKDRLRSAIAAYGLNETDDTAQQIYRAAEPQRQEIIRRLNMPFSGTATLVEMRGFLLDLLQDNRELAGLDADFLHLFSAWFNRGFLVLRRIDWSTSATILEKVIRYEAVHKIDGWDDLRRRLEPSDRRCFAFFHPQLLDEPLIFVEVALTNEIPRSIGSLLAPERKSIDVESVSTAVFYSISNTQRGLAGVSFGDFLIKQVVEELRRDLPKIATFVTLSPIPGFSTWVTRELRSPAGLLDERTREALIVLSGDGWSPDVSIPNSLEQPLLRAAATYLLQAKSADGLPLDAVARFHLRNGASVERLNFGADLSKRGMNQAFGLMVNYFYDLDQIEGNHEAFSSTGKIIASSPVRKLLR